MAVVDAGWADVGPDAPVGMDKPGGTALVACGEVAPAPEDERESD